MNTTIKKPSNIFRTLFSQTNLAFYFRSISLFSALSLFLWYCTRISTNSANSKVPHGYISSYPANHEPVTSSESLVNATPSDHELPRLIPYSEDLLAPWTELGPSLSIVLPVKSNTIAAMTSTLLYLLQKPYGTSEVILIAASDSHNSIRNVVRSLLSNIDSHVDFDISIQSWPPSIPDEVLAILEVAAQVTSERVLILDVHGLVQLHAQVVETILDPPLIDLPIGPRAYNLRGNDFICFSSFEDQPLGFLVPPIVIPTKLLIDLDTLQDESSLGTWAAIFENFASFRPDNVAGVIINLISADTSLCSSEHDHSASKAVSPLLGFDVAPHSIDNTELDLPPVGTFAFVFPFYEDFAYLSPVVCRISKQGHRVHTLISEPSPDQTATTFCDLDFAFVSETSSLDEMGTALSEWILTLPSLPDIIITPDQDHGILIALNFVLRRYSSLLITLIRIPAGDLPFCDWMGSLSMDEWRSEYYPSTPL